MIDKGVGRRGAARGVDVAFALAPDSVDGAVFTEYFASVGDLMMPLESFPVEEWVDENGVRWRAQGPFVFADAGALDLGIVRA